MKVSGWTSLARKSISIITTEISIDFQVTWDRSCESDFTFITWLDSLLERGLKFNNNAPYILYERHENKYYSGEFSLASTENDFEQAVNLLIRYYVLLIKEEKERLNNVIAACGKEILFLTSIRQTNE